MGKTPVRKAVRLLIVDDDEPFRERLASAFRARGYETRMASSCETARLALESFEPTHALVDLRMPGGSGLAFARDLRTRFKSCRIIILTGYGSIPTAVEAIQLGANDYLTKPSSISAIHTALFGTPEQARDPGFDTPSLDRVEWEHLQRVLADCGNNISKAARALRIERRTLQRKLQKHPPAL